MKSYQRWWRWTVLAAGVLGTILAAMLMPWGTILAVAGGTAVVGALLAFGVYTQPVPGERPQGSGPAPSARSLAAAAGLIAARYVLTLATTTTPRAPKAGRMAETRHRSGRDCGDCLGSWRRCCRVPRSVPVGAVPAKQPRSTSRTDILWTRLARTA